MDREGVPPTDSLFISTRDQLIMEKLVHHYIYFVSIDFFHLLFCYKNTLKESENLKLMKFPNAFEIPLLALSNSE